MFIKKWSLLIAALFSSMGAEAATYYSTSKAADTFGIAGFKNQIEALGTHSGYWDMASSVSQYVPYEAKLEGMTREEALDKIDTSLIDWCTNGMTRFKVYIPKHVTYFKVAFVSFPNDDYMGFATFKPLKDNPDNGGYGIDETSNLTKYQSGRSWDFQDNIFAKHKTVEFKMHNLSTIELQPDEIQKYGVNRDGGYLYISLTQANAFTQSDWGHIRNPRVGVAIYMQIENHGNDPQIKEDILSVVPLDADDVNYTEPYEAPMKIRTRECSGDNVLELETEPGVLGPPPTPQEICEQDATNVFMDGHCYSKDEYQCMSEDGEWRDDACVSSKELECESYGATKKWSHDIGECLDIQKENDGEVVYDSQDGEAASIKLEPFYATADGWSTRISLSNTNATAPVVNRIVIKDDLNQTLGEMNVTVQNTEQWDWNGTLFEKDDALFFEAPKDSASNEKTTIQMRGVAKGAVIVEPFERVHVNETEAKMVYGYSASTAASSSAHSSSSSSAPVYGSSSSAAATECGPHETYIPALNMCQPDGTAASSARSSSSSSAPVYGSSSSAAATECGPHETYIPALDTCLSDRTASSSAHSSSSSSAHSSASSEAADSDVTHFDPGPMPEQPEAHAVREYIEKELQEMQVSGYFVQYDFEGVDAQYKWAFINTEGKVFQLRGNAPSENNLFGFKERKDITIPENAHKFIMGSVYNWSQEADDRFSWIILDPNSGNSWKLSGVTENGTFAYTEPLGLGWSIDNAWKKIVFVPSESASSDTAESSSAYANSSDASSEMSSAVSSSSQYSSQASSSDTVESSSSSNAYANSSDASSEMSSAVSSSSAASTSDFPE